MPAEQPPYTLLYPGQVLWHVYAEPYAPTAFNPATRARYSAREATPARAMYYAGTAPACALWETVLRDVVPVSPDEPITLPPLDGLHIARVSLTTTCPILDLRAPAIRWLTGADEAKRERLQASTHTPVYSTTHALAIELLTVFPDAHGLGWYSRQIGAESAFVLYSPPQSPALLAEHETFPLSKPAGLAMIDDALRYARLVRADFEALARETAATLPIDRRDE